MLKHQPDSDRPREGSDPGQRTGARAAADGVMRLFRPVLAGMGLFFIVIGVPIAIMTPFPFIPIGLPIVILGVVLLARNSLAGRRWMQAMIRRHPRLKRFAPDWLLHMIFGDDIEGTT